VAGQRGYLSRLVASMPGIEATTADRACYMELLDRALEDRRVQPEEAASLMAMAREWRLSRQDVEETHEAYLQALAIEARADGTVTQAELDDLSCVAQLLGIEKTRLMTIVESASWRPRQAPPPADLRGLSVCFTGTLLARRRGELITRSRAEALAADAGLVVQPSVTKKLDLLVVADPNTLSTKAKTAARYGTRIMAEMAFWRAIGVSVE
jgi:DNA polymerase-3 subunit epsilon